MNQEHRQVHLGFTEEQFPAATHMCYIFSDENERRRIISAFMARGANDGEKIGYFADRISPDELCSCLREQGVDTDALTASGQLFVDMAERVYCPDQCFCSRRMLETLRSNYLQARDAGFTGFRASGEMDWALAGESDRLRELLWYESQVNDVVDAHPITAICQYDARKFDGAVLHRILEVHPYMVVRGQVVRNPYYIVPSELSL